MMITTKGQVTIPKELREMCGLHPHTEVSFALVDGRITICPAGQAQDLGAHIVEALSGKGDIMLSTDEIMRLTRGED